MGPNIIVCPTCHTPKEPSQLICVVCNTKTCPNGHALSSTERICSECNWLDRNWKPQPINHPATKILEKNMELPPREKCSRCGATVDPKWSKCMYCGSPIDEPEDEPKTEEPREEPVPLPKVEMHTIKQKPAKAKEVAPVNLCPNCGARIEYPGARCTFCGLGSSSFERQTPKYQQETEYSPAPHQHIRQHTPASHGASLPDLRNDNNCPQCGASNPADARFCGVCGVPYTNQNVQFQGGMQQEPPPPPGRGNFSQFYREVEAGTIKNPRPFPAREEIFGRQEPVREQPQAPALKPKINLIFITTVVLLAAIVIILIFLYITKT
jgi:hypothetical protein